MSEQGWRAYRELIGHVREAGLLGSTLSVLGWDQETMLPGGSGAVAYRARQKAQLAGLVHERRVDARVADWLAACEADEAVVGDPRSVPAVNVRELRREYDRSTRLPRDLVERFSEAVSMAVHAWKEARARDDFAAFAPYLEQMVALNRERAECFGYGEGEHIWDALAEGFEPGMRAADVSRLFAPLRDELTELVGQLAERNGDGGGATFVETPLPVERQREFVRWVAEQVGFDFQRGRLDESAHPFCCGVHRDDVRMTTRFQLTEVLDALSSTLHESGHGLYEQGVPGGEGDEHVDTPFGSAVSLAIHESQSRLVENQVGRSRAFWRWCRPHLEAFFGTAVAGYSAEDLYNSMNVVQPSLIRTESDEATYNLHIMVRFELELALLSGDLAVADLPAAWGEAYQRYLGVRVPNDAKGCMQDVHWGNGAIGYFPTYTLGNLYAAQFFEQLSADVGDVDGLIEQGAFGPVIGWLREKVHGEGRRYGAGELCEKVTGRALEAGPFLRYLRGKLLGEG